MFTHQFPTLLVMNGPKDLSKLKSFCRTKETISKVKRQPSEWVKIIANETDKGLISKIYKQPIQQYQKKQTTQSKSGEKS